MGAFSRWFSTVEKILVVLLEVAPVVIDTETHGDISVADWKT